MNPADLLACGSLLVVVTGVVYALVGKKPKRKLYPPPKGRTSEQAALWWEKLGERGRAAQAWGDHHEAKGEYLLAAARYEEAVAHPPASDEKGFRAVSLLKRMLALFLAGHYSTALTAARQIVSEETTDTIKDGLAYRVLAFVYGRVRWFAEAERALDEAGRRDQTAQDISETLALRCLLLLHQGYSSKVVASVFPQVDRSSMPPARLVFWLAAALDELGDFDESEAALRSVIDLVALTEDDPLLPVSSFQYALALVHINQNRFAEALAMLDVAEPSILIQKHERSRREALAVRLRAETLAGMCEPDATRERANELLREIVAHLPSFPNEYDALRYWDETLLYLAETLFYAGDAAGAFAILERFAGRDALRPIHLPRWHYWRGRCQEKLGDLPAARAEYEAVINTAVDPRARYVRLARERPAGAGGDRGTEALC